MEQEILTLIYRNCLHVSSGANEMPSGVYARKDVLGRFMDFVSPEPNSGCWLWTGACSIGYGLLSVNGRMVGAHVASYRLMVGPLPPGTEIDHLCRNPCCVNPQHLEAVTHQVNNARKPKSSQKQPSDTCRRGHPFMPDNARIQLYADGHKGRTCKTCELDYKLTRQVNKPRIALSPKELK